MTAEDESIMMTLPVREVKRLDAIWELFISECTFLIDHLMVLKHVSVKLNH